MKKDNWVSLLMRNYRITFLLLGLLFVFGFYGLEMMPKAEFPDFTIRQGVVVAVYPGATSEEIEAQVARPLERYLFTFPEVKRSATTSSSSNGMCFMMVELEDWVTNKDEVWSKIRHGLNSFKSTSLPSGVLAVVVQDDFGDTSALLIAVESDQRSYKELHQYSEALCDKLRQIKTVSNVRVYGDIREQITLNVDRERLAAYGLTDKEMLSALQTQGFTTMAGSVATSTQNIPIHVSTMLHSEEELANLIIHYDANNNVIRVKDIASIERGYDKSTSYIKQDGHQCIILSLEMKPNNNIVHYGKDVESVLEEFRAMNLPDDVVIKRIADQPEVVGSSVSNFLRDLIISMIIIIVVMIILFPLRTAIVAAITIPLTTFISVGIMYVCGIQLNTISLAGLVIVLGMVVDNSIVVLDGYLEYRRKGMSRWHAAAESAQHYFAPMFLATLCICAIFYPTLFVFDGQTAEFVKTLPATLTINLMVSLVLAVVVIPILETWLIKKIKVQDTHKKTITDWVQICYDMILKWTFKYPWTTICIALIVVVASVVICVPMLKIRTMPFADRNQFAVEIFLSEGKGLDDTQRVADSLYNVLKQDERITNITQFIGCSSPRFQMSYAPQMGGKNFAQFIVNTVSIDATVDILNEYAPQWAYAFPEAYIKFKQLDYQNVPDCEFHIYGENIDSLRMVSEELMDYMRTLNGVEWVHSNFQNPIVIQDVMLNPVAASQQGINRTNAALQIMMNTSDMTVGSVWEGNYEVPIVLHNEGSANMSADKIDNILISSGTAVIPLRQVATVEPKWSEASIVHRNGIRCMTVASETKRNVLPAAIEGKIENFIQSELHIPSGVHVEIGGIKEYNDNILVQIVEIIAIAVIIIFFFLLFNFHDFKLTILSMTALAFLMPGALFGLALVNKMLGLTSLFGLITLMGIIMRNEILIFEHAENLMLKGWSARDAAYDAGKRRMVPIFLTTATTAVGVVPMITGGTSFWMPVGVTIFCGGIGALILVVSVLPVAYWKIKGNK
ncbi:MAG: efflux RND transporter permease subunit [Bacteroidales bacterium]|nr:efflux RND transporter permease subunit [Bacteroidales bacterium]